MPKELVECPHGQALSDQELVIAILEGRGILPWLPTSACPFSHGNEHFFGKGKMNGSVTLHAFSLYPADRVLNMQTAFVRGAELVPFDPTLWMGSFCGSVGRAFASGAAGERARNSLVGLSARGRQMVVIGSSLQIPEGAPMCRGIWGVLDESIFPLLDGVDRCIRHFMCTFLLSGDVAEDLLDPRFGRTQ